MAIDKALKDQAARKFGSILREMREARGWTPSYVAEQIDQTYDTIIKYEGGKREPALYLLLELSDLFQVSVSRLLTCDEFRPRQGRVVSIRRRR